MTEFMTPSDQFMWSLGDDPVLRSTIVTLVLCDTTPEWNDLVDRFERISRVMPRFRQRVRASSLPIPPYWEIDPEFDVLNHLRRMTAPGQVSLDAVLEIATGAATSEFERTRPLWGVALIEGLADGAAALVCRFDHALTDGLGAVQLASILFDDNGSSVRSDPLPEPPPVRPDRSGAVLLAEYEVGVIGRAVHPLRIARSVVTAALRPWDTVSTAASMYRTARPIGGPMSPIMKGRSDLRQLVVYDVDEPPLRSAAHAAGGSINDAFVGAVAAGLSRYHAHHGAPTRELMISMPISVRSAEHPLGGNRATLIRFAVPTGVSDPVERIRRVRERTTRARESRSLGHTSLIAQALNVLPSRYVASQLRHVDFIASDVPGLPAPVYLAGARVRRQYAFSPTLGSALNVTLLSYRDICALGINVDVAAVPDVTELGDCIAAGFAEILALAEASMA